MGLTEVAIDTGFGEVSLVHQGFNEDPVRASMLKSGGLPWGQVLCATALDSPERKAHSGDTQGAALLSQVSPVAWQHINVYGRYEFSREPVATNMQEIIEELDRVPIALAQG
jgi:hypothetical protein